MPPIHSVLDYLTADTDIYSEGVQFYEEGSEVAKGGVLECYRKICYGDAFRVQLRTKIKISCLLGRFTQKTAIETFVEMVGNHSCTWPNYKSC
jgi:hypothetical protein